MTIRRIISILALVFACTTVSVAQRWEQVSIPAPYSNGYYLDVYFLPSNPNYGWACDQMNGYVIRTVDGGNTWQGVQIAPNLHLEYIQFLDTQNGYCTGPGGAYKSTNGGVTWTSMLPNGANVWGAWFRDVNTGWMTGGGCGNNAFYRTEDGGTTWTTFLDTNRKVSKMSDPLWTSDMPAGRVYAVGNQTLWKSDDDGFTWAVAADIGNTNPWMEELAKFGTSWLVSLSPDGCPPGAAESGMRFSDNDGATWRQYLTGRQMFGAFLLSAQSGWAAGYNEAVFYTSDAGRTWDERNCGILDGDHLDDIFFIDQDRGWVVGDHVYRLKDPIAEFSKSSCQFDAVCPDSVMYDTVWVTNKNFFKAGFSALLNGADADLFGIMGSVPDSLGQCERYPLIVRYKPTRSGLHTANLTITMTRTDTTFVVLLTGSRRDRSAYPVDTLVTMQVRVGTPNSIIHRWRATGPPLEDIISITRASGDTSITLFNNALPVTVFTDGALLYINAVAQDTGWTEARFRVRLGPCRRDTFITVRVYGLSPIISSIKTLTIDAKCASLDTFLIPVSNTGNADLTISSMRFIGSGAGAFNIVGWRSGAPTLRSMRPQERDTLVVFGRPATGDDRATLEIDHDDNTLTRGDVDPWLIDLRLRSERPNILSRTAVIDIGTVCIGSTTSKALDLLNDGIAAGTLLAVRVPPYITGVLTTPFNLPPGQSRTFTIVVRPMRSGPFQDTIAFVVTPCNDTVRVLVRGNAGSLIVRIDPRSIVDSVRSGGSITRTATIGIDSIDRASIVDVHLEPTHPDLALVVPSLPATVLRTTPMPVSLTWTGNGTNTYRGVLIARASGACDAADTIPVVFTTYLTDVQFSKRFMRMRTTCTPTPVRDTVIVRSVGTSAQTMEVPTIVPNDGRFIVISPNAATPLPSNVDVPIIVEYLPSGAGRSLSTMTVVLQPGARSVTIDLDGMFETTSSSARDTTADLGTLDACLPPFTRTFTVRNDGDLADTFDLRVVADVNGLMFSTGIDPFVVAPRDSADITLLCEPANLAGGVVSTERLELSSRTCPTVITFTATAQGTGGQLDVTPSRITVGPIALGASERTSITVSNLGAQRRRLTSVSIAPNSPWSIIGDPSPLDMDPGASVTFDVEFVPTAAGTSRATVTLQDSGACTVEHRVELEGSAIDQQVVPERIDVRLDDYVKAPRDIVDIPVHWLRDVTRVKMDSVEIHIACNDLLLDIDTVLQGTWGSAVRATYGKGVVVITAGGVGPTLGAAGTVCIIRGTATSAIPDSTALAFTRVAVWAQDPTTILADDGSLVVDACGPRFLISFGAIRSIQIAPPHPLRDNLGLVIDAAADATISVEIIDAIGNVVATFERMHVDAGKNTIDRPIAGLASGIYIIRVSGDYGPLMSVERLIVR